MDNEERRIHPESMQQLRALLKLHGRRPLELALRHLETAELANVAHLVGKHVEVPAYTDIWMRGARTGEVRSVGLMNDKVIARVKMDNPRAGSKLYRFIAADLTVRS